MSLIHWVVVVLVVILLFGRGKISDVMGDFAKGIRSFKKGLNEDDDAPVPPRTVEHQPPVSVDPAREREQSKP
jgi:sec-independent protein translocase protein TatA